MLESIHIQWSVRHHVDCMGRFERGDCFCIADVFLIFAKQIQPTSSMTLIHTGKEVGGRTNISAGKLATAEVCVCVCVGGGGGFKLVN